MHQYRYFAVSESLERMSLSPLMAFLEHLGLPKTPPLGDNIVGDWVQAVAHIKRHTDKDIVFGFDVLEDPYNNTINRLSIGMPNDDSPLPRCVLSNGARITLLNY